MQTESRKDRVEGVAEGETEDEGVRGEIDLKQWYNEPIEVKAWG